MTMNRFLDIAKDLSEYAIAIIGGRRQLQALDRQVKDHERTMIPDGGWPGKNADERKAAELAAKSSDEQLYEYEIRRQAIQFNLDNDELHRDALLEERDALRWTIRDNEQAAVTGISVLDAWVNTQAGE